MSISVFAPGRVELLGNHTDYNGGVVLSAALDLGVTARGEFLEGGGVELSSEGMESEVADLKNLQRSGRWSDYPLGVAAVFQQAGLSVPGFRGAFASNLPLGAGLSSSAAMEVATGFLLLKLSGAELTPMELAKLCKKAENEFVGVNCGILDQVSSIFGKAGHAIHLDCRAETVETVPFPENASLVIVNSGVKHALTGGEYNERREACFEAARILGVSALRDATMEQLLSATMPEIVQRRAAHIIGENDRVFQALEALRSGNSEVFGRLMSESHQSSIKNFENSTAELNLLVEIANGTPGIFGARLTGGGFGGAIVALAESSKAGEAAQIIESAYQQKSGNSGQALVCRPGQGAWQANR